MKIWTYLLFVAAALFLFSCNDRQAPKQAFDPEAIPSAPDYALIESWSAHPDKKDSADLIPIELSEDLPPSTDQAAADVFFIHPTTYMGGKMWNASLEDEKLNQTTDKWAIRHQASIFNVAGRIFAPRYRQMVYGGFFGEDIESKKLALEVAYQDVKASFEYYLENHNQGRPIIIASHSQGSLHGIRLMKEYFDGKELSEQLICAYLVGWPFKESTFQDLNVCEEPSQTGCVVGWCSWKKGKIPGEAYKGYYDDAIVVNPISWKADDSYAPSSEHQGFVGAAFKKIKTQQVDAQAHEGILWVSKPMPVLTTANYHVGDFNIFWMDVRQNVKERSMTFLKTTDSHSTKRKK